MKATIYGTTTPMNNGSGSVQVTSHSETYTLLESDLEIFNDSFYNSVTISVDAFIKLLTSKFNNLRDALTNPVSTTICRQAGRYQSSNTLVTYGFFTEDWNHDTLLALKQSKADDLVTIINYEFQGYKRNSADAYHLIKGARVLGTLPNYSKTFYVKYDKFTKLVTSISTTEPTLPYVKIDVFAKASGYDPEYTFDENFVAPALKLILASDNTQTLTLANVDNNTHAQAYTRLGITIEQGATQYDFFGGSSYLDFVPQGFLTKEEPHFDISLGIYPAIQTAEVQEIFAKL